MLKHHVHEYKYRTRDHLWQPHSLSLHKGEGNQGSAEIDNWVLDPNPPSSPAEGKAMLRKPHSHCILENKKKLQVKCLWVAVFWFLLVLHQLFFFKKKNLAEYNNLPTEDQPNFCLCCCFTQKATA